MDFAHSEEQQLIRANARAVLRAYTPARRRAALGAPGGYDAALWTQLAGELGWCALAVEEQAGGAGLGWVELCLLQEELGRALVASPFFGTVVLGVALIEALATGEQRRTLLSQVAAGGVRIGCALGGGDGEVPPEGVALTLQHAAGALRLRGTSDFVVHGDSADYLLALAREEGGGALRALWLPADAPGIRVQPHVMLDLTRPMSRVHCADVAVRPEQLLGATVAPDALERALNRARIGLAAEALGGAECVLEMTTEYVKQRLQFGRAIGSFQAVKHRLADMMVQVEAAKSAAWYAACVADENPAELTEAAATAKSYCCDAFYDCAASAIQLHGGIGFTWEHDAHLYFKRARASATLLGSPAWQRERLLGTLGLGTARVPRY
jgi:alkylation response protein AidB-like acyl-CoA dehydrogenase